MASNNIKFNHSYSIYSNSIIYRNVSICYKLASISSSLVLADDMLKDSSHAMKTMLQILCVSPVFSGQLELNTDKNRAPQCTGQGDQKDG